MTVKLLAYTPHPERTVACAAKLCYSAAGIDTVMDGLTPEKTENFLHMLAQLGHESPIEHASFTFGVEGVSRSLLAQLTRHRIASYSVQSQRYVKEAAFDFVVPPEIDNLPEAREEFLRAMEEDAAHYDRLASILQEKHKKALLAQGMDEMEGTVLGVYLHGLAGDEYRKENGSYGMLAGELADYAGRLFKQEDEVHRHG